MLHLGVITLFPKLVEAMQIGITQRALEQGLTRIDCWNPRMWAKPPSMQVDDRPYGGGPGMVMMYEPLSQAITHAKAHMPVSTKVVYVSPQGKVIRQSVLNQIAGQEQPLLFIAGRYEGIDERVISHYVDEEWSLGDFVLSGGELAAMAFMDAIIRLLPGALGHHESAQQDSFMHGLLDHPHYTRPAHIANAAVPDVLLSGDHANIERWRRKQSLGKTWLNRLDLISAQRLTDTDEQLLAEFQSERSK